MFPDCAFSLIPSDERVVRGIFENELETRPESRMEGRGDRSSGRSRSVPQVLVSQSLRVSSGRLGAAVGPPGLRQVHPAGHRPGRTCRARARAQARARTRTRTRTRSHSPRPGSEHGLCAERPGRAVTARSGLLLVFSAHFRRRTLRRRFGRESTLVPTAKLFHLFHMRISCPALGAFHAGDCSY